MKLSRKLHNKFNQPETILVVSSYPARKGELACDNAVARYSKLLLNEFPRNQKVVVVSENRTGNDKPYVDKENILVVPTYRYDSLNFTNSVIKQIVKFNKIKNIHYQFEFSSFGGKNIIPQFIALLTGVKLMNKNNTVMFHQVSLNLNKLSSHLGLKRNSLRISVFNYFLKVFYKLVAIMSDTLIVHDSYLANKLAKVSDVKKIVIIPHGISSFKPTNKNDRNEIRDKYGLSKKDFVVGIFGYKSSYKGTDWLVEAVGKYAESNRNIKLMIMGGESPTLKGTNAYKSFLKKYNSLLRKYSTDLIDTGFVSEDEVEKTLSAVDVVVFPYRSKMSASGAFSVVLGLGIPFIGSTAFKENFTSGDISAALNCVKIAPADLVFRLKFDNFSKTINNFRKISHADDRFKEVGQLVSDERSWNKCAHLYLNAILKKEPAIELSTELASI